MLSTVLDFSSIREIGSHSIPRKAPDPKKKHPNAPSLPTVGVSLYQLTPLIQMSEQVEWWDIPLTLKMKTWGPCQSWIYFTIEMIATLLINWFYDWNSITACNLNNFFSKSQRPVLIGCYCDVMRAKHHLHISLNSTDLFIALRCADIRKFTHHPTLGVKTQGILIPILIPPTLIFRVVKISWDMRE